MDSSYSLYVKKPSAKWLTQQPLPTTILPYQPMRMPVSGRFQRERWLLVSKTRQPTKRLCSQPLLQFHAQKRRPSSTAMVFCFQRPAVHTRPRIQVLISFKLRNVAPDQERRYSAFKGRQSIIDHVTNSLSVSSSRATVFCLQKFAANRPIR